MLVLRNADTAMYEAKGAGKSRVVMAHLVLGTSTSEPEVPRTGPGLLSLRCPRLLSATLEDDQWGTSRHGG